MGKEEMNMIWFNHQDNFKDTMHEILKSNELADVTLVCDDNKEFKVHKIVLTACSPVLKSIFHDLPQINSVIYFTGVQHQEIESILEFMSKHLSVKYPCNKCEYEATQKSSLKHHIQSKHEGV